MRNKYRARYKFMVDYFQYNLSLLSSCQPNLVSAIEGLSFPENINISSSKTGHLIPQIQGINLHSTYNPVDEAKKILSKLFPDNNAPQVIWGLGFGYHILELLNKSDCQIIVIEPMCSLFRAFLSCVDITPYLPRVRFIIGEPPTKVMVKSGTYQNNRFIHNPSYRISLNYFKNLEKCLEADQILNENSLRIMIVNPIYGGSLPTAHYCAMGFKNLGHDVCSVNCEDFSDTFHSIKKVSVTPKYTDVLSNNFMALMSEVVLAKAADFKPDLILAIAQSPVSSDCIKRLKVLNIPIAFWFVEDHRTLNYWKDVACHYDYFFTIQRGEFFDKLKSIGANNNYYLPQACATSIQKPISLNREEFDKYRADLSFMGAGYYNRVNVFQRLLDYDFKIWGTDWRLDSLLGERVQNSNARVSTEESVKIYNSSKIHLNLHSSTFHEEINPNGDFVNPRTFEIAACGGFQLVDERKEIFDLFNVGREIITFKDFDDLREKIKFYLSDDDERKRISDNSRKRVLNDHTFENRLNEMLIFIYSNRLEELKNRVKLKGNKFETMINQAGRDSELGRYLVRFEKTNNLRLKDIIKCIEGDEGKLTSNELLILMVDQVVREGNN